MPRITNISIFNLLDSMRSTMKAVELKNYDAHLNNGWYFNIRIEGEGEDQDIWVTCYHNPNYNSQTMGWLNFDDDDELKWLAKYFGDFIRNCVMAL